MALSVIVTSYESTSTLRLCLRALASQAEAREIVVSDCSQSQPAQLLQAEFPAVTFLQFEAVRTVPQLRWAALPLTTGNIVAVIEARCIPSGNWCTELLAAHESAPQSPAVGGSVTIAHECTNFDWALYFCEYGAFAPPVANGPVHSISGANLSYKRAALDEVADLTARGEWETQIHEGWLQQGLQLTQCSASVTFVNSMSVATALRQRWHYGRGYAADRVSKTPRTTRCFFAIAALGLPALLTLRLACAAIQKKRFRRFLRALGWIAVLNTSWSLGEMAGYLAGKAAVPQNF